MRAALARRNGDKLIAAMAKRHNGGKTLYENHLRDQADRQRRESCPVEAARRHLQSRGHIVYRASVTGGPADRWIVNHNRCCLTDDQLVERAIAHGFTASMVAA